VVPKNITTSFKLPIGKLSVYTDKPSFDFVYLNQVHSSVILDYDNESFDQKAEADGIRFKNSSLLKIPFAIKTADCLPIILIGKESSIFMHAGWRGINKGIILHKKVSEIQPHFAFIGPSIQKNSFQVTSEFRENFPQSKNFGTSEPLTFDLQREAEDQLIQLNPSMTIQNCAECTFANAKYNSYRRDKTEKRNWNIYSI
jgi:YfiH family protein